MKNKKNIGNSLFIIHGLDKSGGFTLIETLIAISIFVGIMMAIIFFGLDISGFGILISDTISVQQDIRLTFQEMAAEIRSMGSSANGSYAIDSALNNSFSFYSDIDSDGVFERVRYFVDATTFKKGVVEPVGNPLIYDSANEIITDKVNNLVVSSSGSFTYYDNYYTGTGPSLAFPVSVHAIRLVRVELTADENPQNPSSRVTSSVSIMIRNFKNQ